MATILVAEDSATQAVQIRMLLETAGHVVDVATNGRAAIGSLSRDLPDVIVTDLNMPEMDGLQLVEHVRSHHSEVPVVLMTADGSEEAAVQALQKGAASYLPKREISQSLVSTVAEILDVIESRRRHAQVMEALVSAESTFRFGNDHRLAGRVIAQLEEQLRTMNYSDATGLLRITMALKEAVTNAIDHGNLELNSDMRDDDATGYSELGTLRAGQDPWKNRHVIITSRVTPEEVRYTIADEGPGFDPSSLPDPTNPENLLRAHGRGLMLIRSFMDEVTHNAAGNLITMIKRREPCNVAADS